MKITKTFLIKEYKRKSVVQIAKESNIPNTCLYRIFDKYQIKRRTQQEAGILRIVRHLCKDCGKQVSRKEYKRCNSCKNKRQHKEYFCIKCGKRISNENGLTGKKRCSSCANIGTNNPMAGKRKFLAVHHIDLNKENNKKSNLLKLPQNIHSSLHHRAYDYLVKLGIIKKYIKWFFNNYTVDLNEKK
jgi:hypothetical protein